MDMQISSFLGVILSLFIFLVLLCWAQLVCFGHEQSHSGRGDRLLRWQATVSELTCFLWLCLSEPCLPKKMLHHGAHTLVRSPSDPSLKAQTAAGEIREERTPRHTQHTRSDAGTQDRSGSDRSGYTFNPARITSTGPLMSVDLQQPHCGPCLLLEPLSPHTYFILGTRLNHSRTGLSLVV